jgi:hypothetical protein|tara:strand:- start:331 stop:534 length:204 start_codon:yes stop_codon:yes gene_type:complete
MSKSETYKRSYNGKYYTYSEGILSMFNDELSDAPIRTYDVILDSEKKFEMEIMWISEKMDSDNSWGN